MQTKESFIKTFTLLGEFLNQFPAGSRNDSPALNSLNERHFDEFYAMVETEHTHNPWFTPEFVKHALQGISKMLDYKVLHKWLEVCHPAISMPIQAKTVGLVLAGNVPLVGFHDLLCVMASGHAVLAKPSSKDERIIRKVATILSEIDPNFGDRIRFTDERLTSVDAVIATGSNNSARYFEYYFRNIPHIIRKHRNGIAVLTGEESEEELVGIGNDIFSYFGLGCRNITKIFIPESYELSVLLRVLDRFNTLYQHHKYGNNVDYYRTIYLMNQFPFLDNGVLLLKEDPSISSPVGVVFYERYSEIRWVQDQLTAHSEEIQCVVSVHPEIIDALPPGTTQEPMPWDYSDKINTLRFLTELT